MASVQPAPRDGEAFDVVLIGGGTGGYVAAIRAKQLGLDVAVVEIGKIGGTCLHQGCIPTKAFLKSADVYEQVQRSAEFGVNIAGDVSFNYPAALDRSLKVVDGQYKGLQFLFDKKYKIPVAAGRGKIADPNSVEVTPNDGSAPYTLQGRNIIVDTGTRPRPIKGLDWDGKRVINSDHAVVLEELPKSFIIRGGGAIGVEWASIYGRYGAKVSLVGHVVPSEEEEAQQVLTRAFKRQSIDVFPTSRPTADDIEVTDSGVRMKVASGQGRGDRGRRPPGCDRSPGQRRGHRPGNSRDPAHGRHHPGRSMMRTNVPNIYAIGDVNGQQMLAHTAMHMGVIAVEHIAGHNPYPLDVTNSPIVTFCRPEIASVGLTEKQAIEKGHNVKTGKFPMRPNGKAVIEGDTDGFTKIIADADTQDLLGLHIVGPHATELIGGVAMGRLLEVTPEEIALSVYPHPTVSEVIHEAALDLLGHALHI